MMRRIILAAGTTLALNGQGLAQQRPQSLPQIEVGGQRIPPEGSGGCAKAPAGSSQSLNCLNQQLKQKVDQVNPPAIDAPLNAGSGDTKIGIVNLQAVQQQYGKNYGHSVIPFRTPPPTFASPLGRH